MPSSPLHVCAQDFKNPLDLFINFSTESNLIVIRACRSSMAARSGDAAVPEQGVAVGVPGVCRCRCELWILATGRGRQTTNNLGSTEEEFIREEG